MNDFDRSTRDMDHDWKKARKGFGAVTAVAILFNLAWMAVVVWAIVQLVQWVITK